ncbi:glycosyltransferase family 4 protein [Clostridium perfringens]|nr:glycosyltransferase family 4 protein [Clostridium perfringens]
MNILYLSLGKEYGGTEKVVENLIQNSTNNVSICCLSGTRFNEVLKEKFSGINRIELKKSNIINNIIILRKFLKENKIDIVHVHSIFSNLIFQLANLGINKKSLITVHSRSDFDRKKGIKGTLMNNLELFLIKRNTKIVTVSKSIKEYLRKNGINRDIKVIYNGVEKIKVNDKENLTNKLKEKYFSKDDLLLVFVGRLTEVKGVFNLIKICKKVQNKNIKFIVIGEGNLKENLENEIKEKDLNNIKMLGFKSDIENYLPYADLLIVPSNMEGIPLCILEAMSCGVPSIASNVGGIPEIIDGNGILYDNKNIDNLIFILDKLENNRDFIEKMKKECFEQFNRKWSVDIFNNNYQEVYKTLK